MLNPSLTQLIQIIESIYWIVGTPVKTDTESVIFCWQTQVPVPAEQWEQTNRKIRIWRRESFIAWAMQEQVVPAGKTQTFHEFSGNSF